MEGIVLAAEEMKIDISCSRVGTMFGFFFTKGPVTNWETAKVADTQRFAKFYQAMLEEGVYLAPSQFEAGFLSLVHGAEEIGDTIVAVARAFSKL